MKDVNHLWETSQCELAYNICDNCMNTTTYKEPIVQLDSVKQACCLGNINIVETEIAQNKEIINMPNSSGIYPIHLATYFKKTEILEILVNNGANPYQKTPKNFSPLSIAKFQLQYFDIFDKGKFLLYMLLNLKVLNL